MGSGMNDREHDQLRSGLGAFVLNAAPAAEMVLVEQHVAGCPECTREVALLRETAAELASLAPPEDASELVDRIASSLPLRRRRIGTRLAVAVAAVAVVAAGVLGTALVRERGRNDRLVGIVASAARRVRLAAEPGFPGRGSVYVSGSRVAVVLDEMPDAGRGRVYQLWAIADAKPVSMTLVSGRGHIERTLRWNGGADKFAITIEPLGGSPVPTTTPVLSGA